MADRAPNLLILMSDQHAAWATGAYGHPFIRTPRIDGMALRGITFDAAYCPSPICVPSRAAFITGRNAHRIEVWDNGSPLRSDFPGWPAYLANAGYQTVLTGKHHFVGPDQRHGFENRLGVEIHHTRIKQSSFDPRVGVDPLDYQKVKIGRHRYDDYDDEIEGHATQFLAGEGRDLKRPFALLASFIRPHFPLTPSQELWDLYWPEHADLPEIPPGYLDRMHPAWAEHRQYYRSDAPTEEELRRIRAAYYALVTAMDRRVGAVLAALDRAGLADDTIVVYTADHGEHAGSRGLLWKSTFFEESVRVPLIVSLPDGKGAGQRRAQVVSLIDLMATLVDLGGATPLEETEGRSFAPLLRGEHQQWEDRAFSGFYDSSTSLPRCMLRLGRYKLNHHVGRPDELYDLDADPGEWHDLAADPGHVAVVADLRRRITEIWGSDEDVVRAWRLSRERRELICAAESSYLGPTAAHSA